MVAPWTLDRLWDTIVAAGDIPRDVPCSAAEAAGGAHVDVASYAVVGPSTRRPFPGHITGVVHARLIATARTRLGQLARELAITGDVGLLDGTSTWEPVTFGLDVETGQVIAQVPSPSGIPTAVGIPADETLFVQVQRWLTGWAWWVARRGPVDPPSGVHVLWPDPSTVRVWFRTADGKVLTGSASTSDVRPGPWPQQHDGADLSGLDLSGADLRSSSLIGARLVGTDLSGADLSGADLSGADLSGADLSGAVVVGTVADGITVDGDTLLPDLWGPSRW